MVGMSSSRIEVVLNELLLQGLKCITNMFIQSRHKVSRILNPNLTGSKLCLVIV